MQMLGQYIKIGHNLPLPCQLRFILHKNPAIWWYTVNNVYKYFHTVVQILEHSSHVIWILIYDKNTSEGTSFHNQTNNGMLSESVLYMFLQSLLQRDAQMLFIFFSLAEIMYQLQRSHSVKLETWKWLWKMNVKGVEGSNHCQLKYYSNIFMEKNKGMKSLFLNRDLMCKMLCHRDQRIWYEFKIYWKFNLSHK